MQLKDLEYYVKLVQTQSYSETASYFHLSQPAISSMVTRLEKEFSQELVVKKTRSAMHVTTAGKILYQHALNFLKEEELLKSDLKRSQNKKFVLGYSEIAGRAWLSSVIQELNHGKLLANLETHQESSKRLVEHLYEGKFDAIVFTHFADQVFKGLQVNDIEKYEFKLLVSEKSTLASAESIDIQQASDLPVIMRHKNYLSTQALQRIFSDRDFRPKKKLFIDSIDTTEILVADGLGVALRIDTGVPAPTGTRLVPLIHNQRIYVYSALAVRTSFVPTSEHQKYLDILLKKKLE